MRSGASEDIENEGEDAYLAGAEPDENPYLEKCEAWNRGWMKGDRNYEKTTH